MNIMGLGIQGIDLNYAALIACVFNNKLSGDKAMRIMGVADERLSQRALKDDFAIKKCERENVRRMYQDEKLTVLQIGQAYGVSRSIIQGFMRRQGIETRSKWKKTINVKVGVTI